MMIWEGSKDPMVNLCVEFRKAVVAELAAKPELNQKILGAFKPDELAEFDRWSRDAVNQSRELQHQIATLGGFDPATAEKLDKIVLDMSEKSAECALRILGKEELQAFVRPESRTQELSDQYKARKYPNLAKIFAP